MIAFITLSLLLILAQSSLCHQYTSTKIGLGELFSCKELGNIKPTSGSKQENSKKLSMVTCEGAEMSITCRTGELIRITDAVFGRKEKELCERLVSLSVTDCSAKDSLEIVKNSCHNKNSCKLKADTNIFSDPCPMVQKYLKVDYSCELVTNGVVCEGTDMSLSCDNNKVINILEAEYGRKDQTTCFNPLSFVSKFVQCIYENSADLVKERCQDKKSCTIPASNSLFGEHCPLTTKYLDVTYSCVGEDYVVISPGPPKINGVTLNTVTISVPNLRQSNAHLYKIQFIEKDSTSDWINPSNDIDLTKPVILHRLTPGKTYDIRVIVKSETDGGCVPFTRFTTEKIKKA